MAICDNNEGPTITVRQGEGTEPCGDPIPGQPSEPCDPGACCNYFKLLKEGEGPSFIFSAGGPFGLHPFITCSPYACPPTFSLVPLPVAVPSPNPPVGLPTLTTPGPLADVICMPGLPTGTYLAKARVEIHNFNPGNRIVVLYRPDCAVATEYVVLDYTSPCGPASALVGFDNQVLTGELAVPNTTCNPGFRILVQNNVCAQCPGQSPAFPYIRNFQFEALRLSNRDIVNCGGSLLDTITALTDLINPGFTCTV